MKSKLRRLLRSHIGSCIINFWLNNVPMFVSLKYFTSDHDTSHSPTHRKPSELIPQTNYNSNNINPRTKYVKHPSYPIFCWLPTHSFGPEHPQLMQLEINGCFPFPGSEHTPQNISFCGETILIIASTASSSRWALAPTPELEHLSAAARPPARTHPDVICRARSPKKWRDFNSKKQDFNKPILAGGWPTPLKNMS